MKHRSRGSRTRLLPVSSRRLERPTVVVAGWGTALPPHRYRQQVLSDHLARSLDGRHARRLRAAFRGARVEARHSVLPDFAADCTAPILFDGTPKSTAQRLRVFRKFAPGLVVGAGGAALREAGIEAGRVTHLLYVTCTGLVAPGPDLDLVERLGVSRTVRRVQIGFQGCSAGLVALRTAAEIVRGQPGAVVLAACVELCSLHFQPVIADEDLRGHALFADGAAAAVIAADDPSRSRGRDRGRRVLLDEGVSLVQPDGRNDMTWEIEDHGFRMRLSKRVPEALATALPGFVRRFDVDAERISHWAVHPGGPTILDHVAQSLGIRPERLECSREVLRGCGNMSSATILFVLDRLRRRGADGEGIALAFGPGLAVDGLRFRISSSPA